MVEQKHSPGGNTEKGNRQDDAHPAYSDRIQVRTLISWALIGLSIVVGLCAAGLWLAQGTSTSPGRVEVIIPTPAPIVVHVLGAVQNEGAYRLPPGSRIADAIDAAGGARTDADLSRLNLAGRAPDGARLHVPLAVASSEADSETGTTQALPEGVQNDLGTDTGEPVDLNTAGLSDLMSLPGIGEKRAEQIITFRDTYGPIVSADDLLEIDGFGPATVDSIRSFVAQSTADNSAEQTADADSSTSTGAEQEEPVDLNTGSLSALMSLPGIGETRAAAIIRFRELNGPIESADDLLEIDGIGRATVDNIRPFVVQP